MLDNPCSNMLAANIRTFSSSIALPCVLIGMVYQAIADRASDGAL
jgi:hypothetical protein